MATEKGDMPKNANGKPSPDTKRAFRANDIIAPDGSGTRGPTLSLCQTLCLDPLSDIENYYRKNHKFSVEIAGENLKYVFCSKPFLDSQCDGSGIGYKYGDMIFVNMNLAPTVVPFAVLYLHYMDLESSQIQKTLGEGADRLNHSEIKAALLESILDIAGRLLRSAEMEQFVGLLQKEPNHDSKMHRDILASISKRYSGESVNALVERTNESNSFYFEQISRYISAHHNNKWVRYSRLVSSNPRLRKWFGSSAAGCEPAHQSIISDRVFKAQIPEIAEMISEIKKHNPGDRITLNEMQSRLFYLCYEPFVNRTKSAPFRFVELDRENRTNVIELRARSKRYFASLEKRILHNVVKEHEIATKALEHIDEVVSRVKLAREDVSGPLKELISRYLLGHIQTTGTTALVPLTKGESQFVVGLTTMLEDHATYTGLIVTSPPEDIKQVLLLSRAKGMLAQLGLDTADLDSKLALMLQGGIKRLENLVSSMK